MELQKGHGTIKKLRTGAVISTLAISALGVSTSVSANETEVAVNEPATRVVAQDEVKPKVPTQSDVDTAKAESDKANQDVAKQKEVVSTTEADIATTEKTIADTTKKVEEVQSVTPQKVAEAKSDAEKKAKELSTAEKTVSDADGKVVDIVDAKAQNKPVNVATMGTKDDKTYQAPAQTTNTKAEPKKQLPNTGTKDSGLLALLGASVGLFALAGKRKYNR